MNEEKTTIAVSSIPSGNYDGYVWYSNATEPKVLLANVRFEGLELTVGENPFVIEAQLYAPSEHKSYSIKFADGKYIALCYDLDALQDLKDVEVTAHRYLPNRMKEVEYLHFKEYWHPVADPNCEGMDVLQPREFVFTGFTLKH